MMIFLWAIIALLQFQSDVEALSCLRCDSKSLDSCLASTTGSETCRFSTDVCSMYIWFSNGEPKISKGCQQGHSCREQFKQVNNDCKFHAGNHPCRCCCSTTGCDYGRTGCVDPGKCPKLPDKIIQWSCSKARREGSTCTWKCPEGYEKSGSNITTCERDSFTQTLHWHPRDQECSKNRCKPSVEIVNGNMTCKNAEEYKNRPGYVYKGTKCVYRCKTGYVPKGAITRKCDGQKWNRKPPKCVILTCKEIPKADFRIDTYSDPKRKVQSTCSFRCKTGYKLEGNELVTCIRDPNNKKFGKWDKEPGKCSKIKCVPPPTNPPNGKVECTDKNNEGSVCTYTCNEGYDITGTVDISIESECVDDKDGDEFGKWTKEPARCTKIICLPLLETPAHGALSCTRGNQVGSVCTFTCNRGYDLEDTVENKIESECRDDGDGDDRGEWSYYPEPTCAEIICVPPHVAPLNGKVSCSNVNRLGSVCTFSCRNGYKLKETKSKTYLSECEDDRDGDAEGLWSKGPPTCEREKCVNITETDTLSIRCSDEFWFSSTCTFQCKSGFVLTHDKELECVKTSDGVEWNNELPGCTEIFCKDQKHDDSVVRTCNPSGSGGNFQIDAVCTYRCAKTPGYYLVSYERPTIAIKSGSLDVTCLEEQRWDRRAPRCLPIECEPQKATDNGFPPECTPDKRSLGSICRYKCHPGYIPSHTKTGECVSNGTDTEKTGVWTEVPPKCINNRCDPFEDVANPKINHGHVDYVPETGHNYKVGTIVNLVCDNEYTYKSHQVAQCMPPENDGGNPFWNQTIDVCCVNCQYNNKFRTVIVLDKTIAQDKEQANMIETWLYYVVDNLFQSYDLVVNLVFYDNEIIDTNALYNVRDEWEFRVADDLTTFRLALRRLVFGGSSSDTAKALERAKNEYLPGYVEGRDPPSREPFVILLKTPLSPIGDSVSVAEQMRRDGINILAMTNREGILKREETALRSITGTEKNVFKIGVVQDFNNVVGRMNEISRLQGCSKASRNFDCV